MEPIVPIVGAKKLEFEQIFSGHFVVVTVAFI